MSSDLQHTPMFTTSTVQLFTLGSQLNSTASVLHVKTTAASSRVNLTSINKSRMSTFPTKATTRASAFWLEWAPYNCQMVDGVCFAIRQRVCSTNQASDCPGLGYDSELCNSKLCKLLYTFLLPSSLELSHKWSLYQLTCRQNTSCNSSS